LCEPKPYWREVPQELRQQIEEKMESPIRTGSRIFGGYGPSATFRIFLVDGRTIFAKGAGPNSSAQKWRGVSHEESVYSNIATIIPSSPRYFGSVSVDGWHLLLLEDLRNVTTVPPWTHALAFQAVRDIAALHLRGVSEADKVDVVNSKGICDNWLNIKNNNDVKDFFLDLFQEHRKEAEVWLDEVIDILIPIEADLMRQDQPWGFIHTDLRSDNLCFRNGTLVLFDWAEACKGPLSADIGFLLPSIEGEGGPLAERVFQEYKQVMSAVGVELPGFTEYAVAVATAGIYASRAGKPPISQHPRLRDMQRLLLGPALRWSCNILGLPQPPVSNFNL
jgi:hypothetical protein